MFSPRPSVAAGSAPHYVITNNDLAAPDQNSASFLTIEADGTLSEKVSIETKGMGIGSGYFGSDRVSVNQNKQASCAYISNAATGTIAGINILKLKVTGAFKGSKSDGGTSNGIGLISNDTYLYAGYSDSNTIGTFQVQSGCKLKFVADISVMGLQGGVIDGMAIHADMLAVTYGDGSIESFSISGGVPVSNGDEQNSTGSKSGNTYPSAVEITADGHFAIFGDVSPFTVIEVSDISSGKLTKTVVYHVSRQISSANILLSPDETLLYISNTQGDRISAAFFDKDTGKLTEGCSSGTLKGYVTDWTYLGSLALQSNTGTGGMVYAAEFGTPSSIAEVAVTSSGGKCTLQELSKSPVTVDSQGLLSIGSFPPRSF